MEKSLETGKLYKVIKGGDDFVYYGSRGNFIEGVKDLEEVLDIQGDILFKDFWRNVLVINCTLFVYSYSRSLPSIPGINDVCWDFKVLYPWMNNLGIMKVVEGAIYTYSGIVYIWRVQ